MGLTKYRLENLNLMKLPIIMILWAILIVVSSFTLAVIYSSTKNILINFAISFVISIIISFIIYIVSKQLKVRHLILYYLICAFSGVVMFIAPFLYDYISNYKNITVEDYISIEVNAGLRDGSRKTKRQTAGDPVNYILHSTPMMLLPSVAMMIFIYSLLRLPFDKKMNQWVEPLPKAFLFSKEIWSGFIKGKISAYEAFQTIHLTNPKLIGNSGDKFVRIHLYKINDKYIIQDDYYFYSVDEEIQSLINKKLETKITFTNKI